ncbi:MAG: imidazole glycerol phosphate synthase subunit HisF [Thermoproteota archaeon]
MGLTKRIIPCLDVYDGVVVKGVKFSNLKRIGDPAELAVKYMEQYADEIVFLDISATPEERETMVEVVKRTAENLFIPLTVGGGVRSVEDFGKLLRAGADKVSVNTAAVKDRSLIRRASSIFGRQCVVVAVDAKRVGEGWEVYVKAGKEPTGLDALEWIKTCEYDGAGEILLTSIDADGTRLGYDVELLQAARRSVNIPIIASGGAGSLQHVYEALTRGGADAALIASLLHYDQYSVLEIKKWLKERGVEVRL